jgi:hypothetical protein
MMGVWFTSVRLQNQVILFDVGNYMTNSYQGEVGFAIAFWVMPTRRLTRLI